MPKDLSPKLKGTLCNVPIETINVSSLLPKQADSNGLVAVQLKKKLEEYRDHVYFEPVHSRFIVRMLEYLKHNNELYRDITIEFNDIPENLLGACEQSSRGGGRGILAKILEDLDHPIEVMLKREGEILY